MRVQYKHRKTQSAPKDTDTSLNCIIDSCKSQAFGGKNARFAQFFSWEKPIGWRMNLGTSDKKSPVDAGEAGALGDQNGEGVVTAHSDASFKPL